ncbi:MAG TPA: CdaR family protein [Roseimicrobium sp.]|nr:CdaR family protein [Roseimicrobium sp.]
MPFRKYVVNNFWTKLFSFVSALLIWATIRFAAIPGDGRLKDFSSAGQESREFTKLPITMLTSAEDPRGYAVQPSLVNVTVSGDAKVLRALNAGEIDAFVNLTDVAEARGLRKRIRVNTPAGVTVTRIDPPDVTIGRIPAGR